MFSPVPLKRLVLVAALCELKSRLLVPGEDQGELDDPLEAATLREQGDHPLADFVADATDDLDRLAGEDDEPRRAVGQRQFRFDLRYRAVTGTTRTEVEKWAKVIKAANMRAD